MIAYDVDLSKFKGDKEYRDSLDEDTFLLVLVRLGPAGANAFKEEAIVRASASASQATGKTENDPKYTQAESVQATAHYDYVHVTFQGRVHRMLRATWGPIDYDQNKRTVLLQEKDGLWYKLWFFDADLKPA